MQTLDHFFVSCPVPYLVEGKAMLRRMMSGITGDVVESVREENGVLAIDALVEHGEKCRCRRCTGIEPEPEPLDPFTSTVRS